ncbi:putative saccharopine dehydrogenase [Diplonema papillatum]|nr:putative saccharopine dehydrogenase [Diplonema papillatum]
MLDLDEKDLSTTTYNQLMLAQAGGSADVRPQEAVAKAVGHPVDGEVIKAMEWLGLFTDNKIEAKTHLDSVCELMKKQPTMYYAEGEKDMIVMKHTYEVEYSDRTEYLSTQLVDYALDDGTTSMSRTVGIPVALATRMVLEGTITGSGIKIPIVADIYNPILDALAKEGIVFEDTVDKVVKKEN